MRGVLSLNLISISFLSPKKRHTFQEKQKSQTPPRHTPDVVSPHSGVCTVHFEGCSLPLYLHTKGISPYVNVFFIPFHITEFNFKLKGF